MSHRPLPPLRMLVLAAACTACLACAPGAGIPPVASGASPQPSASAAASPPAPAPGAPTASTAPAAAQVKAPVAQGAPKLPAEATDGEDAGDGPSDWEAAEWETEIADADWAEDADELALGVSIDDVDLWEGADEDGDGDTDTHALASVTVRDLGEHQIEYDEDDEPLMSDEPDVIRLTDKATGKLLTIVTDQELNSFTLQHDGEELTIELGEDGEYVIDGQSAASIDDAAQAIVDTAVGAETSVHSLAFLKGVVERLQSEMTRGEVGSQIGGGYSYKVLAEEDDESTEDDSEFADDDEDWYPADAQGPIEALIDAVITLRTK